jgi:hypothetical protein
MAEAMRYLAMAIAASHRLGWIALGLYIERMNAAPPANPFYKTILEYRRAMNDPYEFLESIMGWADDHRMVHFPEEFSRRLDAIDDGWGVYHIKEMQKAHIIRRYQRARNEIENIW